MTSPSSGYIGHGRNGSEDSGRPTPFLCKHLPVPASHALMVSFQQRTAHRPDVRLYYYARTYIPSAGRVHEVWDKHSFWRSIEDDLTNGFDVASVHSPRDKSVGVRLFGDSCSSGKNTACFQLLFSFFPEHKAPQKLPSGFWNCSVEEFSRVQGHMECNLKTECEDGRDESQHCSFSSADCQGMVALCGHCYQMLSHRAIFVDANEVGNRHCNSLGGVLKLPTCEYDPYRAITKRSKIHWHIPDSHFVGLYFQDLSLPNIYRTSVVHDKTVFFHYFNDRAIYFTDIKSCVELHLTDMQKQMSNKLCSRVSPALKVLDLVCEFKTNNSEGSSRHAKGISLTPQRFLTKTQPYLVEQPDGHVTYTFLLNGSNQIKASGYFSDQNAVASRFGSVNLEHFIFVFTCANPQTISYSLVCDFIADCVDTSDESFCQYPPCIATFTCQNGQCQPYGNVCDRLSHCHDHSEEQGCEYPRQLPIGAVRFPSPALIIFDDINQFTSSPMAPNHSCPHSHYRCPGEFNDCLPVYTRCNGMYDCRGHEDEEDCWKMTCPGLFQCRFSKVCLHSNHLCDSWPHCPKHDDELWCHMTCPLACLCQGHTFLCPQRFGAGLFPLIRYLNAASSGMTPDDVSSHVYLIHLILVNCSVKLLPEMKTLNLKLLDLSYNKLQNINITSFLLLKNLQSLALSHNPITSLYDTSSAFQDSVLIMLDLSYTALTVFDSRMLAPFVRLKTLNLSFTSIHAIDSNGFQFTPQLSELYLDGSPVESFPSDVFKHLLHLRFIATHNYRLCCSKVLPQHFGAVRCDAPTDEISSCEDLLQSWVYRGFLWLMACLAVSGNVFSFCARLLVKKIPSSRSFSVFVTTLTMADFLMGVYLVVIGVADERFRGRYLHHDDTWKRSVTCKMAGFLSLLSSEASALIICLITADRVIVLGFPFSSWCFDRKSSTMACVLIWWVGLSLASLPLHPLTSHWHFYSQTGICIPLPVTRQDFPGKVYSFGVFIVFNFVLFVLISLGQAFVYWSIQTNATNVSSTKVSQDMTIARRLITIAMTDFLCWFPIGLCGMLALAGFSIPGEMNVVLAIFILPLNSAINPFMYTFNTLAEKRRKSKEAALLNWIEAHPEAISI